MCVCGGGGYNTNSSHSVEHFFTNTNGLVLIEYFFTNTNGLASVKLFFFFFFLQI